MKELAIDIETYSGTNLNRSGVYRYCEDPDFEILLFGYSVDRQSVKVIDLTCGEKIPDEVMHALVETNVIKTAYNAHFERICLSEHLHRFYPQLLKEKFLSPVSWHCTMINAVYMTFPFSLKSVGEVLHLDKQKLEEGKELIKYFCVPCSPTKSNSFRTRNRAKDSPERWELFKAYNKRDVETEIAIKEKLHSFPVPESLWQEYVQDQIINDRGILIDETLVTKAIEINQESREYLETEIIRLTGIQNPNSVLQLTHWLRRQGIQIDALEKKTVMHLLSSTSGTVHQVLVLRSQLAKASVKKYQAMQECVCKDGRARGTFQFFGASRTGRFAGRHIQLQNLPQNHLSDLDGARKLVRGGTYTDISMVYDSVPDVLSQLIRTALIPQPGYKFIVCDYSAIEARVLSWLAGEKWRMDVFANNGDIYCETASRMFHKKVVKNGENGELRQKGKQAELSCGYGGSVGALKAMGALESGMQEDELLPLVQSWREANPKIVQFWWAVDHAIKDAVRLNITTRLSGICFSHRNGLLTVQLPSGRKLFYIHPHFVENGYGGTSIAYEGVGTNKKWCEIESYGPKFVENITQAISRDILCHAMRQLSEFRIVAHVHDEVVIEAPMETTVEEISEIMSKTPVWAEGLVLNADGYACMYYQKN